MKTTVKKSDFVLAPYMKSDDLRATYQILNTLVPYFLLWFLAVKAAAISLWLMPPIIVLITLFSIRCFSLMHDCGHYSLFSSKKINRIVGFILGVINAIPPYSWSRDHAYHHKTNGDWERYRGVATFLSTEEFSKLNGKEQRMYEMLRHPLMTVPGGFLYLALKPRFALLAGSYDFLAYIWACLRRNSGMSRSEIISTHQSKYWESADEFWDLLLNNICVISAWVFFSYLLGAGFFLSLYAITLTLSAVIFISVFFVQHNFEGSYAHKTEGWEYLLGALEGSSYFKLPPLLNWFTADIGYHNIHHLSERIPNYHLEACHRQNSHLLANVKVLTIADMSECAKFILWDSAADTLVSVATFHQAVQVKIKTAAL
ncbi:MAG: fatty acid desaturase [Anaerolineae bacterium]|nr:fatty acid desaturase [Gloeobacterales cyanobacterium ES-bin-313]